MHYKLIASLQQYGLSEKEAHIYLVCLEFGSCVAGMIARKTEAKRATVYSILKELVKKNVVSQIIKGKIMYFSAISPELLVQHLDQRTQAFKCYLPEMMSLVDKENTKQKVQFFEGIDGIKQIYEAILLYPGETLYAFMNLAHADPKIISRINEVYIDLREAKKITAKVLITPESYQHDIYRVIGANSGMLGYSQYKVIQHEDFLIENQINLIGGDKVMIYNFKATEVNGLIIHSPSLYNTMYSIFSLFWNKE